MLHRWRILQSLRGGRFWWASHGLLLAVLLTVSQAQVRTTITPDGSLGTTVTQGGNVYTITGGTRPGNGPNLFHSFDRFSIGTGDIASFYRSETGIKNILSRVTGGQRSDIDGQLRTDGQLRAEGANLYLLNPAGVLFGPNASLDLSGSFHVSTADYLRLADGARFSAHLSDPLLLSVAPPMAFGFLSAQPVGIRIDQSTLQVWVGQTLSVIGGDIEIIGAGRLPPPAANLSAPSGRIYLASVASAGEVVPGLANSSPTLDVSTVRRLGQIRLVQDAFVDASGNERGGGTIVLRAGDLLVDSAALFADTLGGSNGAPIGIDIQVADQVAVRNGGAITADAVSTGNAGAVHLVADNVQLETASFIGSRPLQSGRAGDITVQAREVTLSGGSQISVSTFASGEGGTVHVTAAETLTLQGTDSLGNPSGIFANARGAGTAGSVDIQARDIALSDGAQISGSTFGSGQGAIVAVTATETISLRGTSSDGAFPSGIFVSTQGAGAAGTVHVQARNVSLSDGAEIGIGTFGTGQAGTVSIMALETLTLRGTSPDGSSPTAVFGDALSAGSAGTIQLWARDILLSDGAQISSGTRGSGRGGSVAITATETFTMQGASPDGTSPTRIAVDSTNTAAGTAGTVTVQARNVLLSEGAQISSSTRGSGRGGTVHIQAANDLTLTGPQSGIRTTAQERGDGGDIVLQARHMTLSDGVAISAQSSGAGHAGVIHLQALEQFQSTNSTVTTEATHAGGGNITIEAGRVHLINSRVTAAALGADVDSNGGNVTLQAEAMALNHSQVNARASGGHGGNISLESPQGVVLTDAETCPARRCLDASAGRPELSGTVEVRAPETEVRGAVVPLPQTFASAATLLRNRCAARLREGTPSSLVERGRDGVPAHPGGLLPSRLSAAQPASTTPRAASQRPRTPPVARHSGLQRDAHGQVQITHWPTASASGQGGEGECATR